MSRRARAAELMRRRIFLQLSAGAAGAGILRTVGAARPRVRIKAKVVVVGGGFAGAGCAILMRRLDPAIEVTLVDPDDCYVTCPMSNSVLAGFRGIESISVSRLGLRRAGVNYVRDWVTSIDAQRRRARLAGGAELAYDRLVMAPGIRFLWGSPDGYSRDTSLAMPHAWQAGAQTEILAAQLRRMRDGGVVAISVPTGPMRCPPGPFERASLIAAFLRQAKPRSKVLIFDSNNHFPRQDIFSDAWQSLYPGMIEWIPVVDGGAVVRVAAEGKKILYTSHGAHPVDVANIIPPQAPGIAAVQAGLASDHGWCPINPLTFESLLIAGVHVIGDACIADPMPKAASAANAQARQCALAIAAALDGREPAAPLLESVCYSMLAHRRALSIHGRFQLVDGAIRAVEGSEGPGSESSGSEGSEQEGRNAEHWYKGLVAASFGAQ
jgi:NADPH-dependent 2,4-dienoyl-CoA reductase/sulfur reductase-like enzyme